MHVEQPKEESETHRVLRGQSLPDGCREVREQDGAGLHIGRSAAVQRRVQPAMTSKPETPSSERSRGDSGMATSAPRQQILS